MADLCKQCSIDQFGEDLGDLKGLAKDRDTVYLVICEGCGPTVVDVDGLCVGKCLENHHEEENDAEQVNG